MGFVTEQYEERKAKLDADSAAYDPNYLIAKESGEESGGEAAPAAAAAEEPDPNTAGETPEGYEEQHQPEQ